MSTLAEQWIQQGLEKGIQQGLEKGIQQEKIELARRLLARGMSPVQVADLVELPLDEVTALAH